MQACHALFVLLSAVAISPSSFVHGAQAMSDGGENVTEQSLFSFDDVFGDGVDCLKAGSVLKALSPRGEHMHVWQFWGDVTAVTFALGNGAKVGAYASCTACVPLLLWDRLVRSYRFVSHSVFDVSVHLFAGL